jgi:hypothetical protein
LYTVVAIVVAASFGASLGAGVSSSPWSTDDGATEPARGEPDEAEADGLGADCSPLGLVLQLGASKHKADPDTIQ